MQLSCGLSPTLSILCQDIAKSAQQLPFLYSSSPGSKLCSNTQCLEGSAYLNNVKSHKLGSRCYLTTREEARVIGIQARRPNLPRRFISSQTLAPCDINNMDIELLQKMLDQLCINSICKGKTKQKRDIVFPLHIDPSSKLEAEMMNELNKSWNAYQDSSSHRLPCAKVELNDIKAAQCQIIQMRRTVEMYALNALNELPSNEAQHWHNNAHKILRIVGLVPTATTVDLAKIAIKPSLIKTFNPMINEESCGRLVGSILVWLQLCVYEDKFERVVALHHSGSTDDIVKELETKTLWDTSKHPYWLVFEVEHRLMIRQDQYKVAQHLINNPGDIIQLNMGLGKVSFLKQLLFTESYLI